MTARHVGAALACAIALLALLAAAPSRAADNAGNTSLPGASVEDVLAIARQLSPDLVARALQTDAARARVDIAGSLPDPTLRITSDEMDRMSGPRLNMFVYSVEQDVPLWGKLDLQEAIALAEVARKTAEEQGSDLDLAERVKVAFAAYYQSQNSVRAGRELQRSIGKIASVAHDRYAHGLGSQQDSIQSEIDLARVEAEVARLEAALLGAKGRLNALIQRPLDARLAEPQRLRPMPSEERLDVTYLVERAMSENPLLRADSADIDSAENNRALARRNWYPDITLSAGAIDRGSNGPTGFTASIGFKVPLQWGLHEAQTREATAALGAARAERASRELDIETALAETASALGGNRRVTDLYRRRLIPQGEALLRSTAAAFAVGKLGLSSSLQAQRDLYELRLQLLAAELDEQRQLAAIERLVGEDL